MAKLPIPESTVRPTQGTSPRRATAADFGPDISGLAQGLMSLGSSLQARQDEQEQFQLQMDLAKAQSDQMVAMQQAQTQAPLGAPGFTENRLAAFDSYADKFIEDRRQAGVSEKTLQRASLSLQRMRNSIQGTAMTFQARSHGAKVADDVGETIDVMAKQAAIAPEALASLDDQLEGIIASIPNTDAVTRDRLMDQGRKSLRVAAGLGLAQRDPARVINSLTNPTEPPSFGSDAPRGLRNNNPGNIEFGQFAKSKGASSSDGRFAKFSTPEQGIGAMGDLLKSYQRQGLRTVRQMIGRWAPPSENDTGAYVATVARKMGISPDTPFDFNARPAMAQRMVAAMIGHENGQQPFSMQTIAAGLSGQVSTQPKRVQVASSEDPILANLTLDEQQRVLNQAYTVRNQNASAVRADLDRKVKNAEAAYLSTGEYTGPEIGLRDFLAAYPDDPDKAQDEFDAFDAVRQTGENVAQFKTMPLPEIVAALEEMKPTDTSGDDFSDRQKAFVAAQGAAETVARQRAEDPAGYVRRHFPVVAGAQDAFEQAAPEDRAEAMQTLFAHTQRAYDQLGIPENQRNLLPNTQSTAVLNAFNDNTAPIDQRVAALIGTVLGTPDPEQRALVFEQLIRQDTSLAKFEAAIDAWGRGEQAASMRLFQAGIIDPDKLPGALPGGFKDTDIQATIAEDVMADGEIGDTIYGFSANITGRGEKARRDAALMSDAVKWHMRRGKDLDDAMAQAKRDIYGNVEVFDDDENINVTVPAGTDTDAFAAGAEALKPQIRDALKLLVPKDDGSGPQVQARLLAESYIEDVMANGQWRVVEGGYSFFDTATGKPVTGADGSPLTFTLDDMLSVGRTGAGGGGGF